MQPLESFRSKFRTEALALHRGGGWTVSLRPAQCTLGACVLSLDRACASLGDLEGEEAAGLAAAVRWFEERARRAFDADKFNHLALMMVDDQLHFHALPRYAAERDFADARWTDPGWPGVPDLGHKHPADDALLARVANALRG
jgi:diadenosine tetraphosphate (Ap4A) HIT family hydrolase